MQFILHGSLTFVMSPRTNWSCHRSVVFSRRLCFLCHSLHRLDQPITWHFPKLTFCSAFASHSSLPPFPALTEYTGSEENIDISVLALQSKLNLPLKFPLSHNHKPEAYTSRPGYGQSEQIHVDGGYLYECVCAFVPLSSFQPGFNSSTKSSSI